MFNNTNMSSNKFHNNCDHDNPMDDMDCYLGIEMYDEPFNAVYRKVRHPLPVKKKSKACKSSKRSRSVVRPHYKTSFDTNVQNLCEQFDSLGIATSDLMTPRLAKLYPKIPEHDKKILHRMAMKRTEQMARQEDAHLARKYWDRERAERNCLISEQNEQLTKVIKLKRQQDAVETENRLNYLNECHKISREKIRKELAIRDHKLRQRIRNVEIKKELKNYERQRNELIKLEAATLNQQEMQLDDELRKQECYNLLESRIHRADLQRNQCLNAYKRRLFADNVLQQSLHLANYEEVKRMEQHRLEMIKTQITQRERKFRKFAEQKERIINESKNQARTTAELREIVRQTTKTPDNYSFRGMTPSGGQLILSADRSAGSTVSLYESNVKLG